MTKVCTECYYRKHLDDYYRDTYGRGDGHQSKCKDCVKEVNLARYYARKAEGK